MTGWNARQLDLKLDFLDGGRYVAEIYADASDADHFPKKISVEQKIVDRATRFTAKLAPAGGYAVRLRPAE